MYSPQTLRLHLLQWPKSARFTLFTSFCFIFLFFFTYTIRFDFWLVISPVLCLLVFAHLVYFLNLHYQNQVSWKITNYSWGRRTGNLQVARDRLFIIIFVDICNLIDISGQKASSMGENGYNGTIRKLWCEYCFLILL